MHYLCIAAHHLIPGGHIKTDASMLTTEISQVPLSGVIALLKCAK